METLLNDETDTHHRSGNADTRLQTDAQVEF